MSVEQNNLSFSWILDNKQLSLLVQQLQKHQSQIILFVDTEFMRRTSYWPKPALLQLRAQGKNYLIDPLSITDWTPFTELWVDPSFTKVLHAGTEDLQVLWRLTNHFPNNYCDTQLAESLLSAEHSIGYNAAVKKRLSIELTSSRSQQTSNWLHRPLTQAQCQYAVADIEYLEPIYRSQQEQLTQCEEKLEWLQQLCQQQIHIVRQSCIDDTSKVYLGLKGIGRIIKAIELKRIQRLAQWREQQARERDIVRSYLISDLDLLNLVQNPPEDIQGWRKIPTGRRFDKQKDSAQLQQLLEQAQNQPLPQAPLSRLPKHLSELYTTMVEEKKRIALRHNISHQTLVNKKSLQEFILSQGTTTFGGWRDQLLLAALTQLLQAHS